MKLVVFEPILKFKDRLKEEIIMPKGQGFRTFQTVF